MAMNPDAFSVEPPRFPETDASGEIGRRLLRLMGGQARKNLQWMEEERRASGAGEFRIPDVRGKHRWPLHVLYNAAGSACLFAVLARSGAATREALEASAVVLIRASAKSHPESGSGVERPDLWSRFAAIRMLHVLGLGAWLLWERVDAETRVLIARLLAYEADRFNEEPVPAQLFYDTQAESNAWFGGGLALACCMLKSHPHRDLWQEKAKALMISAYATEADAASDRVVDGRPLRAWLTGPNAFPDHTVENHGFVHADYIAAVSEMVRAAICYGLAGERVPEAVTFNAAHVLDRLIGLNLPDGNHLYMQGSDYTSRRMDSFFQACNLVPLAPDPLRQACFLRSLGRLERMAAERPGMHTSGCLAFAFDLGLQWGLVENYLMRRLFGDGGPAVPEGEIEARLAGVHVSEGGRFAVHRTAKTLSSLSWHAACSPPHLMGLTVPLDPDVLVSPLPAGGWFGEVRERGKEAGPPGFVWSRVQPQSDGFGGMVGLAWCEGKVRQHSAFLSLPDGTSVYMEERVALQDVEVSRAESGNVSLYDDVRWPFQRAPRVFYGPEGTVDPAASERQAGSWVNVDDRMGFAALGADALTFRHREEETDYHTWCLAFESGRPASVSAGERIGLFALIACPWQKKEKTLELEERLQETGWLLSEPGALSLRVGRFLVYAIFSGCHQRFPVDGHPVELAPQSVGYRALK